MPASPPPSIAAPTVEPTRAPDPPHEATPPPPDEPDPPAPASVAPRRLALRDVVDLSAGTCAILAGGRVSCRDDDRWRPVPGLRDIVEVVRGDNHTCARTGAGAVHCWGEWYFGPRNHDGDESDFLRIKTPRRISGLHARALTSREDSDFAVGVDGGVWAWGRAADNNLTPRRSEPPDDLVHLVRATWWECRRRADATARCENTVIPAGAPPFDLAAVVDIAVAEHGGCAAHRDGVVRCWGRGPVGDDTRADRPAPVLVPGLRDAVRVSVGPGHACALSAAGLVRCWGDNREGQLGDGTTRDRLRPTLAQLGAVPGRVLGVVALTDATAVWTDLGEAWTWGAPW